MPNCDWRRSQSAAGTAKLTSSVSCCRDSTQSPVSVTQLSRVGGEHQPKFYRFKSASRLNLFTVSGARQHGHPGFPLFLRPPGVRSICTRPRGRKAAGPRLFRRLAAPAQATKGDGTPRGAVMLPFLVHNRTPVRSISARVPAQRLPMKVHWVGSRIHATAMKPSAKP
jgi:hypothetical protein